MVRMVRLAASSARSDAPPLPERDPGTEADRLV